MPKFKTREEWLKAAVEALRPRYKEHGKLPAQLEVITAWIPTNTRAGGAHFSKAWSASKKVEYIHITPLLKEPGDVLAVLVHELVHALGVEEGKETHGKEFKKVAVALGLTGKMKA